MFGLGVDYSLASHALAPNVHMCHCDMNCKNRDWFLVLFEFYTTISSLLSNDILLQCNAK